MRLVDEFLKHCDEQSYCVGNLYLLRKSLLKLLGAAVVWQRFFYIVQCVLKYNSLYATLMCTHSNDSN